jgi:hypothetical protein
MDALLHEHASTAGRGIAQPFRKDADQLVAMFQTPDAGTPAWHRARARTLLRDTQLHAVSPVTDAWRRLASRHIATALLLERQQSVRADDPVGRRNRFFRDD